MKNHQAPFTWIAQKQSDFVMSKYIPCGLMLKGRRTMRQEDIIKFFKHVSNQQSSHGVKDAFKFKAVLSSCKKGDLNGSQYNDLPQNMGQNINNLAPASPDNVVISGVTPVHTSVF